MQRNQTLNAIYNQQMTKKSMEDTRTLNKNKNKNKLNRLVLQGEVEFQQGNLNSARTLFKQALKIDPTLSLELNNLGGLEDHEGSSEASLQYLFKAYELDSDNKTTVINLFSVLQKWGKADKSQQVLFEYLNIHPEDKEVQGLLDGLLETSKLSYSLNGDNIQNLSSHKFIDNHKLKKYFQPAFGNTEKYISVQPVDVHEKTQSVYQTLKNYNISEIGSGLDAIKAIFQHIIINKLQGKMIWNDKLWDKSVVVTVRCEIKDISRNETFDILKPENIKDISADFYQAEGASREQYILNYAKLLQSGQDLGMPLYVSGHTLKLMGGNSEPNTLFMVDGARRITASAMAHFRYIDVLLIVHEEEFHELLAQEKIDVLKQQISNIGWFRSYQSIPLAGLQGERTLKRFDLMQMNLLRDQTVMDFGCNLGQACIKAVQAGAKDVWGVEGFKETFNATQQIKSITGFKNLHYLNVDFNDSEFEQIINANSPDKVDYAFFFSVYRTRELTQREQLFRYIISKVRKGIFFEGHAAPNIDTPEYHDWLFDCFGLKSIFLGFSEGKLRPLYFLTSKKSDNKLFANNSEETIIKDELTESENSDYLISAIVSTYDSEEFIEGRLKDLLNQTLGNKVEIIVIDSCSPSNEGKIVSRYMKGHKNIKYLRTDERETVYQALNRGVKLSKAKYITFSNTDDRLRLDALEVMINALEENPDVALVYGDFFITSHPNSDFLSHIRTGYSKKPEYTPEIMGTGCHMGPQPVWRRSVHEKIGFFDESLKSAGDFEFWCRIALHYKMLHLGEYLGLYLHNLKGIVNSDASTSANETQLVLNQYKNKFDQYNKKVPTGFYYKESLSKNNFVNIGMVTYNRIDFTRKSIESIVNCTRYPYAITVIDNNSSDGTQLVLKDLYNKGIIKNLVLLNENLGVSKASNIAWQCEPEAEYYLKLDNDIIIQKKNWLRDLINVSNRIEKVGVVGYNFEPISYELKEIETCKVRPKENGNIGGACVLISKRIREKLGYWCEDYGLYGEEDADYGVRVYLAGLLNVYMADEDIGFHLPAGKAAVIDHDSYIAKDGLEEKIDVEYRRQKDRNRARNLLPDSQYNKNVKRYLSDKRSLYICSEINIKNMGEIIADVKGNNVFNKYGFGSTPGEFFKSSSIAVVLHLYYIDLWEELKKSLVAIPVEFDLYISIQEGEAKDISPEILKSFPAAKLYELPNKGRDILPFLTIFNEINFLNYKLILKLHTKKSPHLKGYKGFDDYGKNWREITLRSLALWEKRVSDIFDLFDSNPNLGVFSPVKQLHPFKSTDINYQIVNQLLPGIDKENFDSKNYSYAAGSMFWFRPEALKKILQLNLTEENFEGELGQLDGTVAHAVERLFGVICKSSGYTLTDRISKNDDVIYQEWLSIKSKQGLQQSNLFLQAVNKSLPKIHCLIYVDNENLSLLANTIDSMGAQNYENWHLSVVGCFPCPDELFNEVEQLSWLHISEATNLNVILHSLNVESEWVVFLEAGDVLETHALSACIEYSLYYPDSKVIYSDEDTLTPDGYYYAPNFKPDFNLDLLYSTDYVGGLVFFSLTEHCEFGDVFFPSVFIAYDLILRYLEPFSESTITHKESVLLHRLEAVEKIKIDQVELRASLLTDYFKRVNIQATIDIEHDKGNLFIRYIHDEVPKVSIIIPTKDQLDILKACIDSILEKTSYTNYEVIIVDNQSSEAKTIDYFESLKGSNLIKVIEYDDVYNYSAINNYAISKSLGDYVVLLNNDTMVLQENWLQGMLNYAQCADVGVVGVKLVFPNKTLQHAGVILGMGGNGVAEHPYIGISMDDAGYMNRAMCVQSMSAVTAACLMLKKSTYLEVGGLDEEKFKILYNDIDLCLKVKSLGKRNVWTPYVTLIHHGSSSIKKLKVDEKKRIQTQYEVDSMVEKWLPQLASDPAYNKNLSLKTSDFQIDDSLNVTWGIDCKNKPRVYAFPLDSNGVGQYRVRGPLGALSEAGLIDVSLANNWDSLVFPTPVEIERIKPDVLLLQNGFLDHMLGPWKRYHRFNDVFKVCGLDDLVYMLPHKHPKQGLWPKNVRRKVQELFNHSDRVVVANNALAEEFSKMTSDIVVVPNYLETWRWRNLTQPENKIRKKLRVGWAGGCEHVSDLQFILPVVEALHKEVDWIFMGDISVELKSFVAESYSAVQFDFYPQKLADLDLDLAIAPLGHNKFNECKTNLRLLEYGILGWPVVCTDILPYQNAPVTRVANNVNEWIRVIKDKINEPVALKEEGEALQKWVIENYMLDDHIDEWVAALLP